MSSPRKNVCSSVDNRLKNTGPVSPSKTATSIQGKESLTKPVSVVARESCTRSVIGQGKESSIKSVQGKENLAKPGSAQTSSRSRPVTSSVTPRRSNSVNLGCDQSKKLSRTNSSLSHRSKNSQSLMREDAGKKNTNQMSNPKRGEKPIKEIPQRCRTPSETKPSSRPVINVSVNTTSSPGTSPSKIQADLHERRNKVIETQFIAKKRKFITLKKELLRKQKCVLELYSSMAEMRAQLIKSSARPADDDNWKLENIRIFDLGQLQDLKLAGCIETHGECKEENKQDIEIVNTSQKGQCCTEGSGEEVPVVLQGSTSEIISALENKLRKIPLDSLTLCHKMVSSRNSLLALVDALADDDGSGFTVEAELRRHLDEYQTEAEKFDKLLKEEQELQLQAVGDLISAIRGLSEENEKLRMLLSGQGVPIMQSSQADKEQDRSMRESELETVCADLDSRLKASTAEINELHQRVENIVDQLMAEREKNTALSRQMASLNDHQIAANHLIKEMEEKLNERESKVQKLQKVLDEQSKFRDMTLAAKASAELVSQLEKQRDSLQQQLQQLTEEKERTEKEATVLIFDLDAKLQTSTKRGEREIIKNEKLQEEVNILKGLLAETEARVPKPHQTTSISVQTDPVQGNEAEQQEDEDTKLNREIEQEKKINELWFELQSTEALLQAAQDQAKLLEAEKALLEKTETEKKNQLQEKLKTLEEQLTALEKAEAERSKKMCEQELETERSNLMVVAEKDEEIVRLTKELKEAKKVSELNQQQFVKYEEKVSELYARLTSVKSSEGNSKVLQQKVSELQSQVEEVQNNLTNVEKRNYQLEQMIVQKQLEMEVHDRASRKQQKSLKSKEEQVSALKATLQENSENLEKIKCELASKSEEMKRLYTTLEYKEEKLHRLEKMVRQLEEQRMTKARLRMSEYKNQARNKCPSILLPLSEFYNLKEGTLKRGSKGMDLKSDHSLSGTSSSSSSHGSKKRAMPLDDGDQQQIQSTDFRNMQGDRNNGNLDTVDEFSEDLYHNFQEAIPRKSKSPPSIKKNISLSEYWWKQQQKKKKAALDLYQKNQHRIESYKAQKQSEKVMKYNAVKSPYVDTRDRCSNIGKENNMHRNDGLPDLALRKHGYRPNFKTNFRPCRNGKFYRFLKFSNRYKLPKRACQIYPTIYEESENTDDDVSDSELMENKEDLPHAEQSDSNDKLNIYLDVRTNPELERTNDCSDNDNLDSSHDLICDEMEEELKNDADDDDDDDLEDDFSIATSVHQTNQQHLVHTAAGTDSERFVKLDNYSVYNVIQESDEVHERYHRYIERISPAEARLSDQDKRVRDLTPFLTEPTCKTQNNFRINSIHRSGTNSGWEERNQGFEEVCRDRESDVFPGGEEEEEEEEVRVASTDHEQGTLFPSGGNERDFLVSKSKRLKPVYGTKHWQGSFSPKALEFKHKRKSHNRNPSAEGDDPIDPYPEHERTDLPSELFNRDVFPDKQESTSMVDDHKRSNHFRSALENKPLLPPELVGDFQDSFRSAGNYVMSSGDDRYEMRRTDTISEVSSSTDSSSFPAREKKLKVLFKRKSPLTTSCILSGLEMEHLLYGSRSSLLELEDSCIAMRPYNQTNDRQQRGNIPQIYVKEQLPEKNMKDARFPQKMVLGKGTNELFKHYRELNYSGEHLPGRDNYACVPKICMEEQIPKITSKVVLGKIKLPTKITSKLFRIGDINVCPARSLDPLKLEQVVNRRNLFKLYPGQRHSALAQGEWCKAGIEQRQGDNNENIFEHFKYIRKYPPKLLLNEIIYPAGEGQRKVKKRKVRSPRYIHPVNTDELIKSSVAYLPKQHFASSVFPQHVQRKRLSKHLNSGGRFFSDNKQRQQSLSDTCTGYIHPVDTYEILKSALDIPSRQYLKRPEQLLQRKRSSKHLNCEVRSVSVNKQRKQCLSTTSSGFIQPVDADNLVNSVLAYLPNKCSGRSQFNKRPLQRKRLSNPFSSGVSNKEQRKQYLADLYGIKKAESLSNFTPERGEGLPNKLKIQSDMVLKLPVDSPVTGRKNSVFQMTETCNSEVKKLPLIISSLNLHMTDAKTESKNTFKTSETPSMSTSKSSGVLSTDKLKYIENDSEALNNLLRSEMEEILTKKRSQILSLIPLLEGMKARKSETRRQLSEQIQLIINNASQSLITLILRGYEKTSSNITGNPLKRYENASSNISGNTANILPQFVIETMFCSDDKCVGRNSSVYDSVGSDYPCSSSSRTDDRTSWNSTKHTSWNSTKHTSWSSTMHTTQSSTKQSKEEDTSYRVSSVSSEGIEKHSEGDFESQRNGENYDESNGILQCPFLLKSNGTPACQSVGDSTTYYDTPSTSFWSESHSSRQSVNEKLNLKEEIHEQLPVNAAFRNQGTDKNYPFPVNDTIPEIRPHHVIASLGDISESGYPVTSYESMVNADVLIEPQRAAHRSRSGISPSSFAFLNLYGNSNVVPHNYYPPPQTRHTQSCDLNYSYDYGSFSSENYDLINDAPYHPPIVRNQVYYGDYEYSYPYYPHIKKQVIITDYTDSESDDDDVDCDDDDDGIDGDDDDSEYSDSGTETSSDSYESVSMRYCPHESHYNNNYYYYEVERV